MNNEHFEVADEHGNRSYITVIEKFKHHYTNETMRVVRIEPSYMEDADAYTRVVNEKVFNNYLKRKVSEPIGCVIFDSGAKEEIVKIVRLHSSTHIFEFKTRSGWWYRFNISLTPYIGFLSGYPVEKLEQIPTFERKNENLDVWEPAAIDHIEVREEYW